MVAKIFFGELPDENIHTYSIALRRDKKEIFARLRLERAKGVSVLSDMVTRHGWTHTFSAPAISRLVDSTESCLVFKHQSYLTYTLFCLLRFQFLVF